MKLPKLFCVFRYSSFGLLVEFSTILLLVAANAITAHYLDLFESMQAPFVYMGDPPTGCYWTETNDWVYTFGTTDSCQLWSPQYLLQTSFGIVSWIALYFGTLIYCKVRFSFLCFDGEGEREELRDRKAIVSISNVAYHLVRWPIFLGMAAANDPLVMTIAYWFDLIALVTLGIVILCCFLAGRLWSCIQDDLENYRKERNNPVEDPAQERVDETAGQGCVL